MRYLMTGRFKESLTEYGYRGDIRDSFRNSRLPSSIQNSPCTREKVIYMDKCMVRLQVLRDNCSDPLVLRLGWHGCTFYFWHLLLYRSNNNVPSRDLSYSLSSLVGLSSDLCHISIDFSSDALGAALSAGASPACEVSMCPSGDCWRALLSHVCLFTVRSKA